MQGEAGAGRRDIALIAGVLLAALALRAALFSPFDIMHPDELMQYLEQAKRIATGHGIVPWEFRYGARNGLVAQLLAGPYALGEWLAPGTLAGMYAARIACAALALVALLAAWMLGALVSRRHALVALLVAGLWWESALFSGLLLSEGLAAGPMLLAAALLLRPERSANALRLAGLLLGLGVTIRLQYAPFAGVLALLALGRDGRAWREVVMGGVAALAVGATSDVAMGRAPYHWIWVNLTWNIGEGRAAGFGSSPPLHYLTLLLAHLGPPAPAIAIGAAFSPQRYRPLLIALVVNLVVHSLIDHKEYRFVWLTVLGALVLAAIASLDLFDRILAGRKPGVVLALACATWLGLSAWSWQVTGGARSVRGGSPIPLTALGAAHQPGVCGIALADQYRAHVVSAMLPEGTMLYVAPDTALVEHGPVSLPGTALPSGLTGAANALVFPVRPAGAADYREAGCRSNGAIRVCLYVRPGGCTADPAWTYQAALEREDL